MAATYWQSSTGDVGAGASWSNQVPDSTHTPAVADGRSQRDMTTNLDQSSASFQFITTRDYRGQIGAPGNPYSFKTDGTTVRHVLRGSGNAWINIVTGGIGPIVVDAVSPRTTVHLDNIIGDIYCKGGTVNVLPTCHCGDVYVVNTTARVTIRDRDASELAPSVISVTAGQLTNDRKFDFSNSKLLVSGGLVVQRGTIIGSAYISVTGGVLRYEPNTSTAGLSPGFSITGGTLDVSGSAETIGWTRFIIGPDGHVIGSAIENSSTFAGDVDLREDFP